MNEIIWSKEIDAILKNGISLTPIGVKNWALSQSEALKALNQFKEMQIPLLGGDVCEIVNGNIQYNYDNWYCDKLPNESKLDFVKRSNNKAEEYIKGYKLKDSTKIFFSLTPATLEQ